MAIFSNAYRQSSEDKEMRCYCVRYERNYGMWTKQ